MKLIIVDGYGFVFRAFHSMPPLTRRDGTPIGAVYGFTNMLLRFIEKHTADYIVVALDAGKKTFRHDIYSEYKAHRPPAPEDLIVQLPIIREAISAFNIKVLEQEGVEADDLIASYTTYATQKGVEVMVVSADKDLMQLIRDGVYLYDPIKEKIIGEAEVKEKYSVYPNQMTDYLALLGDASDNIPGVAGIGAKTASKLLKEFDSIEKIYTNIDKISPERSRKLLLEGRDRGILSKNLVTLKCDIDPAYSLEELKTPDIANQQFLDFLTSQGFSQILSRVSKKLNIQDKEEVHIDEELSSLSELYKLNDQIVKSGIIATHCDVECCYLYFDGRQYIIKLNNQASNLFAKSEIITYESFLISIKDIFADPSISKICYSSKDIYKIMIGNNIDAKSIEDISAIAYCIETGRDDHSLKGVLEFASSGPKEDARSILKAYQSLKNRLVSDKLLSLYDAVDRPLNLILARMELKGVKVDTAYLSSLSNQFKAKIRELENDIYSESGEEFNIASPKQLGEVLFVKMGLAGGKKNKSGTFGTGVDVLEDLESSGVSIATKILEWRQLSKLVTTYTDALPKFVNQKSGRIHTSFNATLTSTGRLSSQHPNLQNIPIRSHEGNKIRGAFIAEKGNILISADYSQIELRLLAHVADVQSLKDAFIKGLDIHAATASQIFGVSIDKVDETLRRKAKAINFGIIYGISPFGLAKNLGISRESAKEYIDSYFMRYPGIKAYMDETVVFAKQHGYVKTILGRKCLIPNINSSNFNLRNFSERAAINAPLQGSNADIIKKAMAMLPIELQSCLILQIHDELLFEVPSDIHDQASIEIKRIMEDVVKISIPLTVEIRKGSSWAEAH
jgi:DNA polymerase-1